jgi:hypothetical protein
MIQTPIEVDQDPEPDIRRFSSSIPNNQPPTPANTLSPSTQYTNQDGIPNSRIDRSSYNPSITRSDVDEKHADSYDVRSATDMNRTSIPGDSRDKVEIDVLESRSLSKMPKVRDFAVTNIADPIRRATEKLVPARRDGSLEVAFALPPDRPGTPRPRVRAQPKLMSMTPGWKVSFKVSQDAWRGCWRYCCCSANA